MSFWTTLRRILKTPALMPPRAASMLWTSAGFSMACHESVGHDDQEPLVAGIEEDGDGVKFHESIEKDC
jgi:hypothetical protein